MPSATVAPTAAKLLVARELPWHVCPSLFYFLSSFPPSTRVLSHIRQRSGVAYAKTRAAQQVEGAVSLECSFLFSFFLAMQRVF